MLHLKIISAHDLSKKSITSFIKVVPKIKDSLNENFFAYAVTEKVSKDTDPQYNEDILIPFYCFESVQLIFFEKKLVGERSIARITIPLNLSTFLKPQPITDSIELYYPFDGANATVTYSVSYFPSTNILTQKFQNPMNIFVYLTYDPPLQLNVQEVQMFCKGIGDNGSMVDPSTNAHIRIELEPTKCGPSGLTQVFYFDRIHVASGNFIFYIKSMNYTGTVTLNFATAPQNVSEENCQQYFCNDSNSSVIVNSNNGSQNTYALFPIQLLLKPNEVSINPIKISESDGIHNIPNQIISTKHGNDDFQNMKDYYTNHPEGIVQQKIFNAAFKAIYGSLPAPSGEANVNINVDVELGKSYSLKSAFKYHSINKPPTKILLSLAWTNAAYQTYNVGLCGEGFEALNHVIFYDRHDKNAKVYFDYYDSPTAKERIYFCLDKFDKTMKYISLSALSNLKPKKNSVKKVKNWSNAYCIVSDADTKVELMRFNLPTHDSPCGVIIALFIRGDDDDWKFMPACKYFESKNPLKTPPMSNIDSDDAFRDLVLSGAAK